MKHDWPPRRLPSQEGAAQPPRTIGVLICSYQRPDCLVRGTAALAAQQRPPDDVIIVARVDDTATLALLAAPRTDGLKLRVVTVDQPGTVHALNAGLDACATDILSITDDDTVPHPDWTTRIMAHFSADPELAGLSGRDWCWDGERFDDGRRAVVGRLQWFGRTIGNHHLGVGGPRQVEFFKGANMSFRSEAFRALRFDRRLRGSGAQPCEDMAFSLSIHAAGWKLVYDPDVAIDHYPAPRREPRHYTGFTRVKDSQGLFNLGYNEAIAVWRALSWLGRLSYVTWSVAIGTGVFPGLLQAFRYTPKFGTRSWSRFGSIQRGKFAAVWDVLVDPDGSKSFAVRP